MDAVDLNGGVGPGALMVDVMVALEKEAHGHQDRAESAVVDDVRREGEGGGHGNDLVRHV